MKQKALILTTCFILGVLKLGSASGVGQPGVTDRVPVLLELFTSEGCSSCPPADKLLQKLDRQQRVERADLIVMSEHVDYWNQLGWVDPYSSPAFSKRQQDYASALNSEVYTPQLVVDGRKQVIGSDGSSIERAIQESLRVPKVAVTVNAQKEDGAVRVHLEIRQLPEKPFSAGVYLVLAADQARSHVMRGENAGRDLEHVAVVQSLTKIADVTNASSLQKDVRAAFRPLSQGANLRVIVFVQDPKSRRIIGVEQERL